VSANTKERNVSAPKVRVLMLRDEDVNINVIESSK